MAWQQSERSIYMWTAMLGWVTEIVGARRTASSHAAGIIAEAGAEQGQTPDKRHAH